MPAGPLDEYRKASLAGRSRGVVAGDAALVLWDLADVNPMDIEVSFPPASGYVEYMTAGSGCTNDLLVNRCTEKEIIDCSAQ